MQDWVDRLPAGAMVEDSDPVGTNEAVENLAAIVMGTGGPDGRAPDPDAKRLWDEALPELEQGKTHLLISTATATVISKLLAGDWVPRQVRHEAAADWRETLLAERDIVRAKMRGIVDELKRLDGEKSVLLTEAASMEEALTEYEGATALDAPSVLAGIHRRRAQR